MNAYCYDTRLGKLFLAEDGQGITELSLLTEDEARKAETKREEEGFLHIAAAYDWQETPLLRDAAKQFMEYTEGKRKEFTVKLHPKGTEFQLRVWKALQEIPYGETRSYKQIAQAIGNEKACRAVGMANHNNPIMCMIPCHRVIGANGALVGYAGGLAVKKMLLELEKQSKIIDNKN
jgi:methylated-DNA-[protein]-cysteine S-methyltransferase